MRLSGLFRVEFDPFVDLFPVGAVIGDCRLDESKTLDSRIAQADTKMGESPPRRPLAPRADLTEKTLPANRYRVHSRNY
jgi:hypothetical protein